MNPFVINKTPRTATMGVNPFALIGAVVRAVQRLLRPARSSAKVGIGAAQDLTRTRAELLAENALLRQQVIVLRRGIRRPRIHRDDRLLLLILARLCRRWRDALHVVNPDTLLRWHRDLFKLVWRRKSRPRAQPKRLAPNFVTLIQAMAKNNLLWGAERIRGELLKLGIRVSKRTIQKYMSGVRPPGNRGQTWGTFISNHSHDVWACDFLQLYDVLFRPIFAFFFVVHGTREVVHFNATRHPTDAWVAQQLREATPHCYGPRYLIRDNDDKFGKRFVAVAEDARIEVVKIPPRSPNLNPICERFLGSVRRECLDHVIVLSERQLRRVLKEYVEIYFNRGRPHQGLRQRIPVPKSQSVPMMCEKVIPIPILGGLHHDYQYAA
ncbi:MAG: integrase core domain-containing protein [Chromatiaceae bacterium]